MPNIFETTDAAANIGTTYTLGIGQTAQGNLTAGDNDFYRVNLVAGQTYTFALVGTGNASVNVDDPFLELRNSAGTLLVQSDDDGPGLHSSITVTATTTGAYYLNARAFDANPVTGVGQYGLSAVLGSRAHYDEQMGAGNLLRQNASWSAPGTPVNVTWAARTTFAGSHDAQNQPAPFLQATAAQIAAMQQSLGDFAAVSGLSFTQVNPGGTSDNATLLLSQYTANDGAGAYAIFPVGTPGDTSAGSGQGDLRLNTNSVSGTDLPPGSYSYFTILHELGHALGLPHPGDYNAAPGVSITYATHAQFTQDTHQYTVMSYFDESNTGADFDNYPQTLMMHDILALQQLYGVNNATRAGNTTYGFNSNAGGVYNFATNSTPALCIWDGGGTDTLNVSGFSQNQRIDLRAGSFSNVGGFTSNVSIAFGAVIENAVGGSGADTMFGNSVSNSLYGRNGADVIDGREGNDHLYGGLGADQHIGGAGLDFARYDDANYGNLTIRLDNPALNVGAAAVGDTYVGIECLVGGLGNDTVIGDNLANRLFGQGGTDSILGRNGNDILDGGIGNDHLYGGFGADQHIGGAGIDFARYDDANYGNLTIRLDNPALNVGAAAVGDTYNGIECLVGGLGNDTVVGDNFSNRLYGQGGSDTIYGQAGNDILDGGAGNDLLNGGLGNDTLTGGANNDTFFFNTTLNAATNVDRITDFSVPNDTIRLENAIFTAIGPVGTLAAAAFTIGAAASTAAHRIVYNSATGALIYDSNGSAAGGATQFAILGTGLALTNADFLIT
ncbi:MAG: hypothetical protein F9K19_23745 [Rhizobiaceae bacterium]|nr:MAG: hypothetical protein F9K19_23745 [Rhizobiaceae bacterium]CAG0981052.1 Serralysin B [Rhizobiaceae bacterium]